MYIPVKILLFLATLIGSVFLQIFLSKRESKIPGLILPIITFLIALLFPLYMPMPQEGSSWGFVWNMIVVFLLANIPTYIFLAIYFTSRKRDFRKKQLDKMNIQDLN